MKTVFPESLNLAHPDRLILTIYTGTEHLSYSIYNPEETGSYFYNELSGEKPFDSLENFNESVFKHTFFSLPFLKVQILNRTPNFTFVPDSMYKDENKEDFFQLLFSEPKGLIMTDSLPSAGMKILHHLPENIHLFMKHLFSKQDFIHYSTPLISYFIKKRSMSGSRQMIVNLQEKGLDIFCFSRETLLMGNYFPTKNLQEALYYILFTWKQLQLNQLEDCIQIIGNSFFSEELIEQLTLYIQHIRFPSFPSHICFKDVETERIPFELAALTVCEL